MKRAPLRRAAAVFLRLLRDLAPGQRGPLLRLDPTDVGDKELADFGARILQLLHSQRAQKSHSFVATLDDFLGVLYGLILAKHNNHPFETRRGPVEFQTIVKRAENVAEGTVRTSGNWLAGFHFNSALFRIAATYHRGLKVIAGREDSDFKKNRLLGIVEPAFPNWKHNHLDKIWYEVNDLKHTADGLFSFRTVNRNELNAAVAELLDLFERWSNSDDPGPTSR